MKKLLLITLMSLVALGSASDALARYRSNNNCNSCYSSCESSCVEECPAPPCCEREQTITVREQPRKVCGWVCPDGTREIPAAEARHGDY